MLVVVSEGLIGVAQELDAFLMGESKVQRALEGIAARLTGGFPGDGRQKSIRFPDPGSVPRADGPYRVRDVRTLIALKLAAGLSAPDRLQSLADVLALIRANNLPESLAESLDLSVREKYRELWVASQNPSVL